VERFQDFTKTLKIYFDSIREKQPEIPIFLIGHSMGGLIGADYLLEHQNELSGAVLSGPAITIPDTISKVTILVGKIFSVLLPKLGVAPLVVEGISRDPAVVDAYINDPLVYTGKITARLAAEMIKTMGHVTKHAQNIQLPIMIAQGSQDLLVDPGGAQLLYDRVGSEDKTLKLYDGFYHEIFNEPEHVQVFNDVQSWIEKQLQKT
jgi:alpha-beta hydrolase superfamily lysophospholipase